MRQNPLPLGEASARRAAVRAAKRSFIKSIAGRRQRGPTRPLPQRLGSGYPRLAELLQRLGSGYPRLAESPQASKVLPMNLRTRRKLFEALSRCLWRFRKGFEAALAEFGELSQADFWLPMNSRSFRNGFEALMGEFGELSQADFWLQMNLRSCRKGLGFRWSRLRSRRKGFEAALGEFGELSQADFWLQMPLWSCH